jgi:signal transduction histidine kinase
MNIALRKRLITPILLALTTHLMAQDTVKILATLSLFEQQIVRHSDSTAATAQTAVLLAGQTGSTEWSFKTLRQIGYAYEMENQLPVAADYYKKALGLEKDLHPNQVMSLCLDLAIVHNKLSQYKIAKAFYDQMVALALKNKNLQMLNFAYNGLAMLFDVLNDKEKAVEYNLKAMAIAEQIDDKTGICVSLRNLGMIHLATRDFATALKNSTKSREIAESVNDSFQLAGSLVIEGKVLTGMKQYQAALIMQQRAVTILEKINDRRGLTECLTYMSDNYIQQGQWAQAEVIYKRCLTLKDYFDFYGQPNFYYNLGIFYNKQRKYAEALPLLSQALTLATERQLKDIIHKTHFALSELYAAQKNSTSAHWHLSKAYTYADSIYNEEKTKRIAEAQFKYDVAESEKQVSDLKFQQSRWLFGGLALVLLLIIGALFYVLRLKNKNNAALAHKNKVIAQHNRKLEESMAILKQFAYISAHDLKEPLRSISSFTHILKHRYKNILPPDADEYMGFITTGVKRLESLLFALLEYTTIAAENPEITEGVSVKKALEKVSVNLDLSIQEKQAVIHCPDTLPVLWLHGFHVTQLFQNIIANAIKFCDQTPVITITYEYTEKDIVFAIRDNGIGMKEEYSNKIFLLFQRLTKTSEDESVGIGLTICKNIIDKYEGQIWFESEEHKGTCFFIALPRTLVVADAFHVKTKTKVSNTNIKTNNAPLELVEYAH